MAKPAATADDDVIPVLVEERRAMRQELLALREAGAGVVHIDKRRT